MERIYFSVEASTLGLSVGGFPGVIEYRCEPGEPISRFFTTSADVHRDADGDVTDVVYTDSKGRKLQVWND